MQFVIIIIVIAVCVFVYVHIVLAHLLSGYGRGLGPLDKKEGSFGFELLLQIITKKTPKYYICYMCCIMLTVLETKELC